MGGLGNFADFQEVNFGITLVFSFQILPLVFGGYVVVKGGVTKDKCKEE